MQEIPEQNHADAEVSNTNTSADKAWARQTATACAGAAVPTKTFTVFVVDDNPATRATMQYLLEDHGYVVECFADGSAFLKSYRAGRRGCLLVDALMPAMSGIELIEHLKRNGMELPTIVMSVNPALRMVVDAIKAGARDFIEKPASGEVLLASVNLALDEAEANYANSDFCKVAAQRIASLTKRQHEILDRVDQSRTDATARAHTSISI
jgi:FixJ family two-component response regulator